MKALTVVWNEAGDECVGFTDPADARYAATGKDLTGMGVSAIADSFYELHEGDAVRLEDVVVVGAEGLESIRKVRLYHWNCAIEVTAHMGRIELKPPPTSRHNTWVRKNTMFHLKRAHATHMTFVQILNQFFDIGDTAEKDAAK